MSTMPLPEAVLLEMHQSLGGQKYQTSKKAKFATAQDSMEAHSSMLVDISRSIFDALGMDKEAQESAIQYFLGFAHSYKTMELNTWTHDADQRQILWMVLGHFFIPGLARHVAFWSIDQPLDKGMPGGRFWYLPEPREADGRTTLALPVTQVVDWLFDLLGMPVERFADEHSEFVHGEHDALRRSLYNWRNKTTIKPDTVHKYFHDGVQLDFGGGFQPDGSLPLHEQFSAAREFVTRKGLNADLLRQEIPMTMPGRLEAILDGTPDDDEQSEFIACLADRYAVPSPRTIRQRLLLARSVQDGYVRMLKFLCPGVDRQCADHRQNKLMQLFVIYKLIHNLTIDAYRHCGDQGEAAENAWFEAHLPAWEKHGLFLSILPSCRLTSSHDVAHLLTRRFFDMQAGAELEDLFWLDDQPINAIAQQKIDWLRAYYDELGRTKTLIERMRRSSPWRALQKEQSYWVVSQAAQHDSLPPRAKKAAIQRLRELTATPAQFVQAILLELNAHLNCERKDRSKDTQARVQALLDEAEASDGYELWRAALLQYKAKHLLACNDFAGAGKLFKEALAAGLERNYGTLRGEVAWDCLAVEVANQKLIINNHAKYYREILDGGILEVEDLDSVPPFEEVAREVAAYFWDTLYKPYHGVQALKPRTEEVGKGMMVEWFGLFNDYSKKKAQEWIRDNRRLLQSQLPDVEGNSVVMLAIKMHSSFTKNGSPERKLIRAGYPTESRQLEAMLDNWHQFIKQLAEESPNQLNIRDLKGQTPLMLVAENGDTELVQTMLQAGADPEIQDWNGMTALHSAVKSYVDDCVDALLDHPCRLDKRTCDGRSALHTASWSGNVHAVKRLVQLAPELAWERDAKEETPLEMTEALIDNPSMLKELAAMRIQGRNGYATKQDLLEVARILEEAEPAL